MKLSRMTSFTFIIISLLFLISCSKDALEETKGEELSIYPLTGEETTLEEAKKRAVGVMINHHVDARPLMGISSADLVFEILTEGEITRLMAIYQSDFPEKVGSIRSAREYYFDLADGYDAIYTYHGAANFINEKIKEKNIDYINGALYDNDRLLFERRSDRVAPHNSYVLFNQLYEEAKSLGYEIDKSPKPLQFENSPLQDGDDATSVQIKYSKNDAYNPIFIYEREKGTYKRTMQNEAVIDEANNEEVHVENVFIVEMKHHVFDSEGRRDIDLTSGGTAYLFSDGKMEKLQWENKSGQIIPVKNNEEVSFKHGKTWINVVPEKPGIDEVITIGNE